MKGRKCYLGIDLSSGGDLTSIALVFPPLTDDPAYVWSHSYIPELRLAEHERTDDVPYGYWVSRGLLTPTSGIYGIKTDYKHIVAELAELIDQYKLQVIGCGYDRHNIDTLLGDLENILPCDLTDIAQSARSLNDTTLDFQLSVKAGTVAYDKENALLTWSMVNAIISQPNSFGEIKIDKMTQKQRIDPCDAVLDAWKLYFTDGKRPIDGNANIDLFLEEMGLEGGENG
jgi:phage terminase large subunit-like protein